MCCPLAGLCFGFQYRCNVVEPKVSVEGTPSVVLGLIKSSIPVCKSSRHILMAQSASKSQKIGPMGVVKNFHGVDSTCSQIACPRRSTIVVHHLPCQANLPIGQQQFVIEYSCESFFQAEHLGLGIPASYLFAHTPGIIH